MPLLTSLFSAFFDAGVDDDTIGVARSGAWGSVAVGPGDILPKYLIVVVVSFPLILLLYALLVRPFNPVRFFFGMRLKRKPPVQ